MYFRCPYLLHTFSDIQNKNLDIQNNLLLVSENIFLDIGN